MAEQNEEKDNKKDQLSPMMQHYMEKKEEYKDCLLFYRLGDFYEMFFNDAILASKELEITLTGRACGQEERAPMCGVPFHAADMYISKLISKGYKVAICEQLEDPKTAKGIVKRDVIRVVTPGTVIESNLLEEKKNNFIMSIVKKGLFFGIAVCDVSTGDFFSTQITENNNFEKLLDEIARFIPSEIITNQMMIESEKEIERIKDRISVCISTINEESFSEKAELIENLYTVENETDRPVKENLFAIAAINGLTAYLNETQKTKLGHINRIKLYKTTKYMALDISARRNLELTERMRDKSKKGTLIWVLDKTSTSMGGRMLRRWINDPLVDVKEINERLDSVKELKDNMILRGDLISALNKVYDIERLAGKIAYGNVNARELISLKNSLSRLPEIKKELTQAQSPMLKRLYDELDELTDIAELIEKSIVDEPPISVKEGGIIKKGYNELIDEYREAGTEGKNWIVALEAKEKERTGIKNLKINYAKNTGYSIDIPILGVKNFKNNIEEFTLKQKLSSMEKYTTKTLLGLEEKILSLKLKSYEIEFDTYSKLREYAKELTDPLREFSFDVALKDVILSFAKLAVKNNYKRPKFTSL